MIRLGVDGGGTVTDLVGGDDADGRTVLEARTIPSRKHQLSVLIGSTINLQKCIATTEKMIGICVPGPLPGCGCGWGGVRVHNGGVHNRVFYNRWFQGIFL